MYIKDLIAISPQSTFNNTFSKGVIRSFEGKRYEAIEPDYMGSIPLNLLRRMGKAIRMGIGAALPLIKRNAKTDGIIIGTSDGGLEDCIKFLNQIVQYEEGTLTPTNFVQSTPNALAGQLALMNSNTGYNITHVHKGLAFENALLDAQLLLEERKGKSLLVGNVEEISDYNFNIENAAGHFKVDDVKSNELLSSNTPGTVCGEGSCMFIMHSDSENTLAEIIDIDHIVFPSIFDIKNKVRLFLERNKIVANDVSTLFLGKNGDVNTDFWYDEIHKSFFSEARVFTYKNLVGEYPTSSAFALYMAVNVLNENKVTPKNKSVKKNLTLIYNHYKGNQHSLILLQR